MSKRLEELRLKISLNDRLSPALRRMQSGVDRFTRHSRKAFMNTAAGVTALMAATASFGQTINPANDLNNALGEVRSLGVAEDTLKNLNQAGLQFSAQFGESASQYVRSAYDIQSAIDGLAGNDLPKFTTAAGTLAKATKANVADITSYFGSMYGIFRGQANEMGKAKWVEMLAGQTAQAVQMFKTTGPEMSSAFESVGAEAQTMGIRLSEQMAILGNLQSTMSGSEAGTKYRAFLQGVGKAQSKLGLSFVDDSGKLLPMVQILEKIKGKFGDIDTLAESDTLKKAFGSAEASGFLKLMAGNLQKLKGDIDALGNTTGMDKAVWMAKQMDDPWARLGAGIRGVSIAIYQKALPVIEPYVRQIVALTQTLIGWADQYPHLTKMIGLAAIGITALVAVGGILALGIGALQFAFTGLLAIKGALFLFFGGLKTAIFTVLPGIYSLTMALLACPLTWIVLGIAAVIAALVALVVYWDDVTAAVTRFINDPMAGLSAGWQWLRSQFENNTFLQVAFWPLYAGIKVIDFFIEQAQKIPAFFSGLAEWFKSFDLWAALRAQFPQIVEMLNLIPGVDIALNDATVTQRQEYEETNRQLVLPGANVDQQLANNGGILNQVSNRFGDNKRSIHVDKMEVNNQGEAVSGDKLLYEMEMAAG